MNPLDPVKWGAQAAFAVTSTAVKIGMNAVKTFELLLGRDSGDDAEQRYAPVARPVAPPAARPAAPPEPPPAPAVPPIPRGERKPTAVDPPVPEARFKRESVEDAVVETEGSADPGATLRVDAPFDGYDGLRASEVVARLRSSDDATKAVVRLYEQTHKKRKSVLAATEG